MLKGKTVSFCAVVKDNLQNLKRMIESLRGGFDEIIIVDTGSSKDAQEYLKSVATKFFSKSWDNDFAKFRNFSIEQSSSDWIFTLDSDEAASKQLVKMIPSLILKDVDGYKLPRVHYAGENRPMRDYWRQLRLYRREARYVGAVHESIKNLRKVVSIDDFDLAILHYNERAFQRDKSLKYSKYLEDEIKKAELSGNNDMVEYYKYKLWVQDNVYLLETDSNVDQKKLDKRYEEYEKKKQLIDAKIKKEGWFKP